MFSKAISLGLLATLVGMGVLGITPASTVHAQEGTPPPDSGCIACHENLYFLHDTGKSFCLCAKKMSCTCCHGGNPESLVEDEAHLDMVVNPVIEEGATCQKCHAADTQAHIEKFATVAGVSPFHPTPGSSTPIPAEAFLLPVDARPIANIPARLLQPWRLVVLGVLGVALAGLLVFGYRCWKADCLTRNRPQ